MDFNNMTAHQIHEFINEAKEALARLDRVTNLKIKRDKILYAKQGQSAKSLFAEPKEIKEPKLSQSVQNEIAKLEAEIARLDAIINA